MTPMAQLGGFEEGSAEQTFLQDVSRKLGRRKLFIVGATALLFVVLAAAIQVLPRTYEGTATVEVESQTPHAVAVRDVLGDPTFTDETMGTELAILNSRELLSRVVDQLKLTADPEFNPNLTPGLLDGASPALVSLFSRWAPALVHSLWPDDKAAPTREQEYADVLDALRKHLSMAPVSHSRVMQISAYSHDRHKAALIANAVVDSYIALHLEQKSAVSGEAHRFIEKQLGELREAANNAAQAVEDYRNQNGLIAGEKNTLLQEELTQASNQLLEARGKLAALNTQWQAIKGGNPENAAAVIADPTITRLREQESTLEMQLANMGRRYGADSSFLGPLKAQLGAVRASIAAEARRQVPSLQYAVSAQQANVDALVARLSDLIGRVRKMELARAHLATLSDESRAAHDIYVNFLSRAKETDRDVQWTATPAANVRVISQAADPLRPWFPNNRVMLPAALILSFGAACGTALVAESRKRGVLSMRQIEALFGVAPLGLIPLRTERTEAIYHDATEQLWNRLVFDGGPGNASWKSLMITSTLPSEGKTTLARALAEVAVNRGLRVLLIDADMRSARAKRELVGGHVIGLGDVLRGELNPHDALHPSPTGVMTLPAGRARGNPTRRLSLPTLEATLRQLERDYDHVIIDAPPALVGGDCWSLSRLVDRTVFLMKWASTPPEQASVALNRLFTAGRPDEAGGTMSKVA
ncbi:MAG: polysaccharide biosynthesis tyrosine autokinase, partial [Acetobacteraceae bacterium]|nr:polysaccharide biosynthesis tyrosine autokinase [Acetobacteraceae bacterium]